MPTTPASSRYGCSFADIDGFPSPFSGDLFGIGFDSTAASLSHHHLLLPTPVHGGPLLTPRHVMSAPSSAGSSVAGHHQTVTTAAPIDLHSHTTAAAAADGGAASLQGGQATEDEVSSTGLEHGLQLREVVGAGGAVGVVLVQRADLDEDMDIARLERFTIIIAQP